MELLTGLHAIEEAIKAKNSGTLYLSANGTRAKSIEVLANKNKLKVLKISKDDMEKMVGKDNRGVAFELSSEVTNSKFIDLKNYLKSFKKEKSTILILDSISDPHNYGAILRSCDKFGIDLVIIRDRRSVHETNVVAQSSAGAINYIKSAVVPNLNTAIEDLKNAGFWVYGADINGTSLSKTNFAPRTAIVLGSEGKGISQLTLTKCDEVFTIPTTGHIDSLNVSVAAGIIMYERFKTSAE